ncbi:MAG TPA: hypothetical protein VMD97_02945 [Candidatus Aquilonibacter sp.]|nr:hypothetical protein [Candidatus Aquilonibacter sp.]
MNPRTALPVAFALSALSLAALAQNPPLAPAPSHWKLNVSASDFGGAPQPTSITTNIYADTESNLRWSRSVVTSKGTSTESWRGAYDGKLRPTTGAMHDKFSIRRDGTFHVEGGDGSTVDGTIIAADDLKSYTETATVKDKDGHEFHEKLIFDRVK